MNIGPLLRKALTGGALRAAYERVRANDGCAGTDGQTIDAFGTSLEREIGTLVREVVRETYAPRPLLRIWVRRAHRKPRPLGIPAVRDRVLQTAVGDTIYDLVEAELEACSYGYRRGRGVRDAVDRIQLLQRQGYRWVVDADIEQFFDEIPHDALISRLGSVVAEPRLIGLVSAWLKTPVRHGTTTQAVDGGVPQGAPISPLLANLYLDALDEALLDANHVMVRYADDFLVLAKSKERAGHALEITRATLERLKLRLNPVKSRVVSLEHGLEFLGWNFVGTMAIPSHRATRELGERFSRRSEIELSDVKVESSAAGEALEPSGSSDLGSAEGEAFATAWGSRTGSTDEWKFECKGDVALDEDASEDEERQPTSAAVAPLQRTLYLVDPNATVRVVAGRIQVDLEGREVLQLPPANIDCVIAFGPAQITTQALHTLMRVGAGVAFLTRLGRFVGRCDPGGTGSLELARRQFDTHDNSNFSLAVCRTLIRAKIERSAVVLASYLRRRKMSTDVAKSVASLREMSPRVVQMGSIDSVRGLEGSAADKYWSAWSTMMQPQWKFSGRRARPAPDPVNAMLSFAYAILRQCIGGLVRARGLDPRLGCLHVGRGGHEALVSDLMEPWRAVVADAAVFGLVLRGRVQVSDFRFGGDRCAMSRNASRMLVRAVEDHLNAMRKTEDSDGAALDMRRWIDRDVRSYVRAIRVGDGALFALSPWR